MAAQKSMYAPAWDRLKQDQVLRISLKFSADASDEDKDLMFTRVRKGISKRKDQDLDFRAANPTSKIHVLDRNYATGVLALELRGITGHFTLSDLSAL